MASNEEVDVMVEHSYGGGAEQMEIQDEQSEGLVTHVLPELGEELVVVIETEAELEHHHLVDPNTEVHLHVPDQLVTTELTEEVVSGANSEVTEEIIAGTNSEVNEEIIADMNEELTQATDERAATDEYTEIRIKEEDEKLNEISQISVPEAAVSNYDKASTGKLKETIRKADAIIEIFPFVCGICSSKFDKIKKFYAHFKTHSEFQSALHICKNEGMKQSMDAAAADKTETEVFSCGVCEDEFPSMCLLHDHMLKEEMIADYRYYNHIVLPVYGRVVNSKDIAKKNDKDSKSQESGESPATPKRPRGRPRKDSVIKKEPEDEIVVEPERKKLKFDGNEDTESNETITKATSTPHSYGTRRQSALKSDKSGVTSLGKHKVNDEKGGKRKDQSPAHKKSPCVTSYNKSTVNQQILKKNFEMSTRKKTYKMTKEEESEEEKESAKERRKDIEGKDDSTTEESLSKERDSGADNVDNVDNEILADQLIEISNNTVSEDENETNLNLNEETPQKSQEQKQLMNVEHSEEADKVPETLKAENRRKALKKTKSKFIPCEECGKLMPRKGLARHRVVHMLTRNYECAMCGKFFKSQSHLTDHKRVVHASRCHECTLCKRNFKTKQALEKHHFLHVRKGEMGDGTGEPKANASLTEAQLAALGRVSCELCGKSVLKTSMKKHMLAHSNVRKFKCDVCGAAFKLQSHVKEHMDVVHLKIKKYKCEICESMFKSSKNLWVHRNTHMNPKDPHFSEAVVAQLQREQKNRALRQKHVMPKSVVCDICGKTVLHKRLNRHKSIHKNIKDFECDICFKKFISQRYVNDHKLKVHTSARQFCDICGQFFKGKSYLDKHRQIHGPRDKVCDTCGKAFTTEFYLKLHRQTHTDKKAFKCDHCPAAFSHKKRLSEHMSEKHDMGEKRPCKYCFLEFPSRQKARFHERRVHEGFEDKKRSKKKRLQIKQEPFTIGEEYHVIVSQDLRSDSGDPQIKILTEKFEATEEVELIDASASTDSQEVVTHSQLLDAVIQSGSQDQQGETVEIENDAEIVQHVLEIPETADRVCALVVYPDGSYRLVNPNDIGPDVKIVAEVATG